MAMEATVSGETPSPEFQLQFLIHVQNLLTEGGFSATYKYALLLALADIAVENQIDPGAPLVISVSRIAEKHILYYWRQAAPYPRFEREGVILSQNTNLSRPATLVKKMDQARHDHRTFGELRRDDVGWKRLVADVKATFWNNALWRLQTVGNKDVEFLYPNQPIGTPVSDITLLPGIAFCLRRFHPLLTQMIRGEWLAYVRKVNSVALGTTTDLAEFLFGSDRGDLSGIRPAFTELQNGACFYCKRDLKQVGDVDHFIPWSRYPVDLGHNFVIAHRSCNGAKGSMLAAEEHLGRWVDRNRTMGTEIENACDTAGMTHDYDASMQIATWAYEQEATAGGVVWVHGNAAQPISRSWQQVLMEPCGP
jgi:hypothetical protein